MDKTIRTIRGFKGPGLWIRFEDALVFSFAKLVGKAFEDESRVLYGEAELC